MAGYIQFDGNRILPQIHGDVKPQNVLLTLAEVGFFLTKPQFTAVVFVAQTVGKTCWFTVFQLVKTGCLKVYPLILKYPSGEYSFQAYDGWWKSM